MIITLYASKSASKTSLAVSMAVYLGQQKQRVVLADVDVPQNSAHKWLKIRRSKPLPNQDWVQATDFFDVEELKGLNKEFKFVIVDCSGKADLNSFNAIDLCT